MIYDKLWMSDKGMAPQVLTYPGTRPTEKGEHCGHHQSTAFPPRRPRPPGRAPPRLQRWLDNARRARGRPRDGRGVGGARALPLQQVCGAKQGRRECSPGRGILRGPGPFIWSIGWSIGAKEGRPRPLHIWQPTQRRTYKQRGWVDLDPPCTYQITSPSLCAEITH